MRYLTYIVFFTVLCFQSVLLQAQYSHTDFRSNQCLNGWWDFQPILTEEGKKHGSPGIIPTQGWLEGAMVVPGSWSRTPSELRTEKQVWDQWQIANSFDLPEEWSKTLTAWYRHSFSLKEVKKDKAYFLKFDGILRESWIYVNGKEIGHRTEGTLPSDHDISQAIKPGKNEIIVYITDYKRDENGRPFVQIGNDQMRSHTGIWGDVFLEERPLVRVEDLTIRTSTRKNELAVIFSVVNTTNKKVVFSPEFTINEHAKTQLSFTGEIITLLPGERKEFTKVNSWKGYIPWSPANPQLYYLNLALKNEKGYFDIYSERFGFREIWIEGHDFILNGNPIHMLGEWGHKDHFDFFRPEYVRQWFGMLKDMHINYIRTHTFPHPKFMIDLADEMGILVCLESSWFMSGKQALDKDEFWDNAKVHARDNIRNYKNHPSVILWSTGNEVRWGWNIGEVIKHGPEIQKIYDEADPTRIAFSDGSTSLWDERSQLVISRHYGVECTGEEFWDKSKPLHVGEIGKWHYGQPIDNLVWGDDAIFGSFEKCATAIAEEGADIILQGRSNEVSCLFPWNISCLDNYRPSPKETRHDWQDFNTPYAKPTRTGAYVSEFAWWEPESKGYIPGAGFKLIQHANRPFAIYIREKLNQIFSNQEIIHTVSLINDLGKDITGILKVEAFIGNKKVYYHQIDAQVKNGKTSKTEIKIPQISVDRKENILVTTSFWNGKTLIDSVQRNFWITPALENSVKWDVGSWLVYGKGLVRNLLNKHGVQFRNIDKLDSLPLAKEKLLLIERNMIEAGSKQNKILREYMERGGRVFLMEQENNAMPSLTIESKPSERCFIRAYDHPLMGKFNADDFSYWGNAPYGKNNSESWVVIKPFIKPTSGNTTILLDCGYGDFGSGGLNWTPLFETKSGKGLLISSQLRLTDRMEVHPSAQKVVKEIMNYLNTTVLPKGQSVFALGDIDLKALENIGAKTGSEKDACVIIASGKDVLKSNISEKFKEKVTTGAIVFIHDLDSADIVNVSKQWNIEVAPVNLGPQYNLVRTADVGTLNGISNQETYWLDKAHYTPTTNKNTKITDWLMRTTQGKSLLESESQSCWREFYTLGAQSEWLRMPVVTHYLYNGPREHASAMLEFNIGKGKLILTQVPFPMDNYAKAEIFWAQLLTNYHITFKDNLFDGEKVANGSQKSNGYPESMKMIKNPDQNLAEQIISKGDPGETSERFTNQGLSQGFKWENIKTENGMLKLNNDCKEVFIYYELNPGRPRKLQEVTGGWPDPSQQTFIDLKGKGRLTLFVNGKKYQSIQLDGGTVSIADIDLNQAWNTILIHFEPSSPDFQMQWRNRQSRPEMEFMFK